MIWDYGGVFSGSPFGAMAGLAREMGVDPSRYLELVFGPYDDDTDHPWHRLERGEITLAAARIKLGKQKDLVLGNMAAKRDWGFAGDYVRAMHLMLKQRKADDYVVGTGEAPSVRDCAKIAFKAAGLNYEDFVRAEDAEFLRPAEVDHLRADASKAREKLHWEPTVSFPELIQMMVESDLQQEAKAG